MTKLCARGKAAAKRKFKVYPSHMRMLMHLKYVQVKQKTHLVLKRKDWGPKKAKRNFVKLYNKGVTKGIAGHEYK